MGAVRDIEISFRMKEVRVFFNMSRERFARALSVSTSHLSNIEGGRRAVTVDNLRMLREKFGVSSDYILYGTGKMFLGDDSDGNSIYSLPDSEKLIKLLQLYEYFTKYRCLEYDKDNDINIPELIRQVDEGMRRVFYKQYKDKIRIADRVRNVNKNKLQ